MEDQKKRIYIMETEAFKNRDLKTNKPKIGFLLDHRTKLENKQLRQYYYNFKIHSINDFIEKCGGHPYPLVFQDFLYIPDII